MGRIWRHSLCRPWGGGGPGSVSCPLSIGHIKPPIRVALAGRPRCYGSWRRSEPRFTSTRSPGRCPPRFLKIGTCGRPSGSKPFSAPPRPSKAVTVIWLKCITIIEACRSGGTRCGRPCITSIVAPQMAQRQRLDFLGGHFRTSLKRFYPILRFCLGLDNANTMEC